MIKTQGFRRRESYKGKSRYRRDRRVYDLTGSVYGPVVGTSTQFMSSKIMDLEGRGLCREVEGR